MRRPLPVLLAALPVSAVLSLFPASLQAQATERGPDGHIRFHVPGVEVFEIPNAPFTAQTATDWTRTSPDGTSIKLHLNAVIARDSSGRVYRERRGFVPAGGATLSPLNEIEVFDPVSSAKTTCTMVTHHCVVTSFHARTSFQLAAVGPFANGTRILTREPLGSREVAGLETTGMRETVTVNTGVLGNDRPLVTTNEFWYSPDLQTNLAVTRNDPENGLQVIQLSNVSRSEPEASQFAVPAGFTVQNNVAAEAAATTP